MQEYLNPHKAVVGAHDAKTHADRVPVLLRRLGALPIAVDQGITARVWSETVALALANGLTVYDGACVELAKRAGLALATLDERLARAAVAEGVARIG